VVAILQARMSSSRLPGKVLKPLVGAPMILRQIERLRRADALDGIVVATSTEASDDVLCDACRAVGIEVTRGDLDDVLDRYRQAARALGDPAHVVRLTADCPLADWTVVDACVALHLRAGADYTSNVVQRSFPKGLDVEVMTLTALDRAWREATDPYDREHVTPYIHRHPELFALAHLTQAADQSAWRWTVDTPEDWAMVEAVYQALYRQDDLFTTDAVAKFLETHPQTARLNGALG
jgi:spore coat polysaccharide biosynthesis protein SpsF